MPSGQRALHDLLASLVAEHESETSGNNNTSADEEEDSTTPEEASSSERAMRDLEKVEAHLRKEDWTFITTHRDRGIIQTSATGRNGSYRIILNVKEADQILIVYIYCPSKVPPEKRLDIAEFITRANYNVMIGNFEMDFADGELRYKGAIQYSGGELTEKMIDVLIGKSAYTTDHYYPGLMKVIYGNITAKDAISEIEPSQSGGDAVATAVAELLGAIAGIESTSETSIDMPAVDISGDSPTSASSDNDPPVVVVATPSPEE